MMTRIHQVFGISPERHEELFSEVVAASQAGDGATTAMFAKYDAESIIVGMQFMALMADATKQRKTIHTPKHPERN